MAHRSRLAGMIIDCRTDDLDGAAAFWAAVFGSRIRQPEGETYVRLDEQAGLHLEVQTVDHESRVHLDIETDDIPAEITRLEKLGAKKIAAIRTWVVMEAPTGHRFCLIRAQTRDFDALAHTWPDDEEDEG